MAAVLISPPKDTLPVHISLGFQDSWQGQLASHLTRLELERRLPTAELVDVPLAAGVIGSTDLLVLDGDSLTGDSHNLAVLAEAFGDASAASLAWQGVHLDDAVAQGPMRQLATAARSVTVSEARTGDQIRQLAPETDIPELPDIGLLARRLVGPANIRNRSSADNEGTASGAVLVDASIREPVARAFGSSNDWPVTTFDAGGPSHVVEAVEVARVIISSDPRLLAIAFSLGRPLIAVGSADRDDRLRVTFGGGIEAAVRVDDLARAAENGSPWAVDRTLLPALQAELDAHFDRLATLAAESAWRRRRAAEVDVPGAARLDDRSARRFAAELNASGTMARRVAEERSLVMARDREVAMERDRLATLDAQYQATRDEIAALRLTRTFRYTSHLRSSYVRILQVLGRR